MKLNPSPIHKRLNKAYLKQDLNRVQIESLKSNLKLLFSKTEIAEQKKEHEEHFKNIVSDFLKDTYYKNQYEININQRKDLVIHNGKTSSTSVGVIIEAKKPSNQTEMISEKTPNTKALHELLHYYMNERFIKENKELKHIIATNSYDWYIFDAADFEKFFYNDKTIRKNYEDWNNGILVGSNTDWFYNEVAKPYIDKELAELEAIHFNLLDYKEIIENSEPGDDAKLVDLYKILSPEHLLKKPFANDSNTLNKEFYNELLHIIGLEEKADGGKKLIGRKVQNREDGSLLENAINILKIRDKLKTFENPEHFGDTEEQQIYSIGLELCITWLNRVLFLKLLEGQLIKYHHCDPDYAFVNAKNIRDFDELDELFFEVLAVKPGERTKSVNDKYGNIPYLNSSLFEISELESKTIQVSDLKDRLDLNLYAHSVLKNKDKNKQLEAKNTLHYLFEFLDAYNFSSDSSAKIQESSKTIINASVLGLIFEKINGYKDGSFFTPGFITMYMSRETIRRAVAQKFKELENAEIENFEDVKNYCSRFFKKEDVARFNSHIDSLKICDPAVGSGHFLVSVLNEIIAIKSELNILIDRDGMPLEYEITVDNDELTVLNKRTNKPFEYLMGDDNKPPKSLQIVQVALFEEKQKIIENCLFGVDINPKSVLICRLRLWIELLKSAYYKSSPNDPSKLLELETLPNIDINIKCGNSLISRFNLNDNHSALPAATQQKIRLATTRYKEQVIIYKSTSDKKTRQNAEKEIARLKDEFARINNPNDADFKKLKDKKAELGAAPMLFSREEQDAWKLKTEALAAEVSELENAYNEKLKTLYGNALEWRFEFPEVLDENGDFVGFDVVIGNPPYGVKFNNDEKGFFKDFYNDIHVRTPESFNYFIKRFSTISNIKATCSLIIPSSFLNQIEFEKTRKMILTNSSPFLILNLGDEVFDDVAAPTCIIGFAKEGLWTNIQYHDLTAIDRKELGHEIHNAHLEIEKDHFLGNHSFSFIFRKNKSILNKCYKENPTLKDIAEDVATGISPGLGDAFIIESKKANDLKLEKEILKKLVIGGEITKYTLLPKSNKFIIYFSSSLDVKDYPFCLSHLTIFKEKLENRVETKSGAIPWYVMLRPRRQKLFEQPKILIRQTANRIIAAYDDDKWYCLKSGIIVQLPENSEFKYFYMLGLLNSELMNFLYHDLVNEDNRIFPEVKPIQLFKLPIKKASDESQKVISNYVSEIIQLKHENHEAEITQLEKQIDQLVYELYGLSPEEIAIVENA